jgi:hypothetical protein
MTDAITDRLASIRGRLDHVERSLDVAREVQWEKSPAPPAARDDTSERSKGGAVSNPTLDVVADDRRLAVRAEITRAEAFARYLDGALRVIAEGLDDSVSAWEGLTR